jgi:TonB-dependent receptor
MKIKTFNTDKKYSMSFQKTLILLVFVFSTSLFSVLAQNIKINLKIKNQSLSEVLNQLEVKSGYSFLVRSNDVNLKELVTIDVVNKSVEDILTILFEKNKINFEITGKSISIFKPQKNQNNTPTNVPKPNRKISGIVLDEKGLPVIGASVIIPGTNIGVATDINGRFTLEAPANAKIRISYIGYEPKMEELKASSDMKISLEQTPKLLSEMVITAQAIGQKNAIRQQINSNTLKNVVAADRLQENPDANATEAIGRLPGISVSRSGGEGTGLVIRGLESKYTNVTLNGVAMPSTGGGRETSVSGISQYVLQGVEVYKSLTADMEANAVAGTVNMKLRQTIPGFHSNVMAQFGYNNMNNYWGNYKLQGEVSNRFFKDKLGVFFTATAEKVNRSTQTMSAGYGLNGIGVDNILINTVNLNDIHKIKYRRSAMLSLDYKVSPSTVLNLYGLYNYSNDDSQNQSKSYNVAARTVNKNFSYNPFNKTNMIQSALSGNTKWKFMEMDYGVAFSQTVNDNPQSRSWGYGYNKKLVKIDFSNAEKKASPEDIILKFNDNVVTDSILELKSIGQTKSYMSERNYTGYLNIKVPFKIADVLSGFVKFGGTYRTKKRFQDVTSGSQGFEVNQFGRSILADSLPWLVTGTDNQLSASGLANHQVTNFIDGKYNYGSYYDFDKLNQITDKWAQVSDYYYNQGYNVWSRIFGEINKIGFSQDVSGCIINDQDITENYGAGYLMTELNIGKWLMLLPGVRYEKTNANMHGYNGIITTYTGPVNDPINADSTYAERSDEFLLPMLHLRLKPTDWFYIHSAYTQTLSRPSFNTMSPTTMINTSFEPFSYTSQNPEIRAEKWTNYDLQFTFHGPKIGLFSVSGFYKTVQDKIWGRSFTRIKGDPIINPFPDVSNVIVNITENHQYPIYLKGVEVELQTSFWYLPKPFSYFTFYANYTYTDSETQYPYTRILSVVPPGGGRPVTIRKDSTTTGVMLMQPKHIANFSLGYNKNSLNVWLSYQYNGGITQAYDNVMEMEPVKEFYNRWDLQISQKLSGKWKGVQVLLNVANLSDFMETTRLKGDPRPTYLEKYGWTADVGVRYNF